MPPMIPVTFLPLYTNHFSRTMALIGFPGSIQDCRPITVPKRLADIDPYARYYSIVQSSGMSKSHLLDELSKSRFMIPTNLRKGGSTGLSSCYFLQGLPNLSHRLSPLRQ
jgi:hypothetical protein